MLRVKGARRRANTPLRCRRQPEGEGGRRQCGEDATPMEHAWKM